MCGTSHAFLPPNPLAPPSGRRRHNAARGFILGKDDPTKPAWQTGREAGRALGENQRALSAVAEIQR